MHGVKKGIAATLLGMLYMATIYGQHNALAAIRKICNGYNSNTAIHFTASMKMYEKKNPAKIVDRLQGSYTIKNNQFYCSIGSITMLLNEAYHVSVDNAGKLILVGRKKDLPTMASSPVLNLDQLEKWINAKKIQAAVTVTGDSRVLQLTDTLGVSGFNSYSIAYNAGSGYMKNLLLEKTSGSETGKVMVLEIQYSVPVPADNVSNIFSEKSFFSVVNRRLQLAPAYKNYQLINQL